MATTTNAAFQKFLENITVSQDASATATARRNRIVELLQNGFEIVSAFPTGSLVRRTAHRRFADVDVMVQLHFDKHIRGRTPQRVLEGVRTHLSEYNAQIVKKNGQAVTLYFTTWPNVDIVPCFGNDIGGGRILLSIPDGPSGKWISTNPSGHDKPIADRPLEARQLIRMVKAWNHAHSEYLRSFHIETIALSSEIEVGDWPWTVLRYFMQAFERIDYALNHPDSLNGRVDEYLGYFDRVEAKKRLGEAYERTKNAWYVATKQNNHAEAIRQYRIVFGEDFPAYG